ncbi:hypothetical protein AVEN_257327-1 [Araneus ventricosus]|uniref:Uncharacterized protein n=1 Tax=Araneus ventricosus TaxID=182803 RepID=A0A4Y2CA96_ARAVE|nr:hypothetical protein AVEN_257327-1 [Araneus ventricosus]
MEFLTFWKIPGMPRISQAATEMRATTSSTESTGDSYTNVFISPQQNKCRHDRAHHSYHIGESRVRRRIGIFSKLPYMNAPILHHQRNVATGYRVTPKDSIPLLE